MKFDYHVNLTQICPKLLWAMITVDHIYNEFDEHMNISLAGKNYIKSDSPKDKETTKHIVNLIKKKLTSDFMISSDNGEIEVKWNPRKEQNENSKIVN